jgi:exo-beta-1,3-glucanase (GH17 family)
MKKALISCFILMCCVSALAAERLDLTKQQWNGNGICYSGYREGQHPDKNAFPTQAQIAEDLKIVAKNWKLIRTYDSGQHSEDILTVIRREKIDLKVMVGAWLSGKPEKRGDNDKQIAEAIRLANEYKDIVAAVSVGNEALVSWSDHRLTEDEVIPFIKRVKSAVKCPVTVDDDFLYWKEPKSKVADVVDFIALHTYPMWGKQDIDTAFSGTVKVFEEVKRAHPDKAIVLGEIGWASYTVGEQHAPGAGSEVKQKRYYEEITNWAKANGVTIFFFEAFDEPWKGSGTEGHWGLFSEGRKAKLAMQELYPELKPNRPTSTSSENSSSDSAKTAAPTAKQ